MAPVLVGVNLTLTVHEVAAAKVLAVGPFGQVVAVMAYWLAPVPVTASVPRRSGPVPELRMVTVETALLVFSATLPKANETGVTVSAGVCAALAVPDSTLAMGVASTYE